MRKKLIPKTKTSKMIEYTLVETYSNNCKNASIIEFTKDVVGLFLYRGFIPSYRVAKDFFKKPQIAYVQWESFDLKKGDYDEIYSWVIENKGMLLDLPQFKLLGYKIQYIKELEWCKNYSEWIKDIQKITK